MRGRDPLLLLLLLGGTLLTGAYALDLGGHRAQALVAWLIVPPLDVLLFLWSRAVARTPGLPRPARHFWWALAAAGLVFLCGDTVQCVALLADPHADGLAFHPAQSAAALIGLVLVCVAALRYPAASWTSAASTRFALDAGIVATAAATVAWCLVTGGGRDVYLPVALGSGLLFCAVFLVVRMGVSGHSPMSTAAAVLLVASVLAQVAATALVPTLGAEHANLQLVLAFAPCVLVAAGPRVQLLGGGSSAAVRAGARPARWWHGLPPYLGTVVCVVALILTLTTGGLGRTAWGALGGLVLNVTLVVARQMVSLGENNRLVDEIRRREQLLESMLRHSSEITSIAGEDGTFRYVSPAVERLLGLPVGYVLGRSSREILHAEDEQRLGADLDHLYRTPGAEMTYQGRYRRSDGTWRWLEVHAVNLSHQPGIGGVICNARDITESRELHERLRFQAGHDELTGLANRREFTAATAGVAGDAAVLLIDLNGFKQINDGYGHAAGDAVLRHVAAVLIECADPDDVPARLGGDEFAVLVRGGAPAADLLAARLRTALTRPVTIDGKPVTVGASIGVACGPACDPDHLLNTADLRMYEEKRSYAS
ncbi:diguanylate cyclase [Actinoplanes missouriensis]|uniref:diguanylate cyclase domain-containing protein n=1 Tax=Actinoplanes missouriensis TaxID=1866 RepID=UPI0033E5A185